MKDLDLKNKEDCFLMFIEQGHNFYLELPGYQITELKDNALDKFCYAKDFKKGKTIYYYNSIEKCANCGGLIENVGLVKTSYFKIHPPMITFYCMSCIKEINKVILETTTEVKLIVITTNIPKEAKQRLFITKLELCNHRNNNLTNAVNFNTPYVIDRTTHKYQESIEGAQIGKIELAKEFKPLGYYKDKSFGEIYKEISQKEANKITLNQGLRELHLIVTAKPINNQLEYNDKKLLTNKGAV